MPVLLILICFTYLLHLVGQSSISARATYSIEDDDEEESGSGAETVTSQSSSESAVTAEEVPIESTRNSTLRGNFSCFCIF